LWCDDAPFANSLFDEFVLDAEDFVEVVGVEVVVDEDVDVEVVVVVRFLSGGSNDNKSPL